MNAFHTLQPLERRCLFASLPPTVLGLSFHIVVTSGTAPLETAGEYIIRFSSTDRTYKVIPISANIHKSSGIFAYSGAGQIWTESSGGGHFTIDPTFVTQTTGTIKVSRDAGGRQNGTFTLSGPDFASVSNGVMSVPGTGEGDTISAILLKHQYVVTRNNISQRFDTPGISRIDIVAGAGSDAINVATLPVPFNVDAGDGKDSVTAGSGETLAGSGAVDSILGGDGNDVIDSHLLGFPTYVNAGAGNDSVNTGPGSDTITGGAGRNTLIGNDGGDRIKGSGAADLLIGGGGKDRLWGGGGNDTVDGGGNVDRLFGGDGDDSLIGGGADDSLYGEAGNDTLIGGGGTDLLDGGGGDDQLYPGSLP